MIHYMVTYDYIVYHNTLITPYYIIHRQPDKRPLARLARCLAVPCTPRGATSGARLVFARTRKLRTSFSRRPRGAVKEATG